MTKFYLLRYVLYEAQRTVHFKCKSIPLFFTIHAPAWKPELLPLKKAAVPKIWSNNSNLQFVTRGLVTEGDREMPNGIFWDRAYPYGIREMLSFPTPCGQETW